MKRTTLHKLSRLDMESFEEIGTETKSSPIILTDDWFWRVLLRSWLMPLAAAIQVSVKCSIKDLVFELKGGFWHNSKYELQNKICRLVIGTTISIALTLINHSSEFERNKTTL